MNSVPIDQTAIAAAGMTCTVSSNGNSAVFSFPDPDNAKRTLSVGVQVANGNLQFFPERSYMQRTVLQKLGIPL